MTQDPSRRDFLKSSTAAVVTGAVAANLSIARSAHAAGDDLIKVGLVGCGGRGTGAATQALSTKGEVKLVAMGDAFEDRLKGALGGITNEMAKQNAKDRVDVPMERQFVGFDAYQKVIDSGVDLVILATPPGFRPIHLAAAVKAKKHVFMEKPVAVDGPGVRSVIESAEAAKKQNTGIGVGLQRRHEYRYLETIAKLHEGAIGDIHTLRVYWNGAGVWMNPRKTDMTEMQYQMRNWYYFNWLCGDHICEQHIHNLDVGNWVKNAYPVSCNGMGGRQVRTGKEFGEIYDHHSVEYIFGDGARMFSQCRHIPNTWNSVTEYCQGTKGDSDISGSKIDVKGSDPWRYRGKGGNPYQVEHDDLFASIRAGKPLNEGEYGAKSSLTSIMGRMATYTGKVITWEEAMNSKVVLAPDSFTWDTKPKSAPNAEGFYPIAMPGVDMAKHV